MPLKRAIHERGCLAFAGLARLVQQIRRALAAVLLLAGYAACVIPLAPEFEEEPNLPPFLVSANPPVGSVVSRSDGDPVFQVVIEDPNGGDQLHARWIIDYPPFDRNSSRTAREDRPPPAGEGRRNRHPIVFAPNCLLHSIAPTTTRHRLMLAVSDRPFLEPDRGMVLPPPDRPLDAIEPGAYLLPLAWSFDMDCR
jgi:hypothetical protein